MKKQLFILIHLLVVALCSSAQITFQKTYGGTGDEWGLFGTQVSDGGYILGGSTTSFGTGTDHNYLIKTDENGNILWTKTYGGFYSAIRFVQQLNDKGFIIADQALSTVNLGLDFNLIRTDSVGNFIWTKSYGGVYSDAIRCVQQTNDSGYIFTGIIDTTDGSMGSYACVLLIKTNSVGDTLWTRTMGFGADYGYWVRQTNDGGYIVTGVSSFADRDVSLIKIDVNGNIQWSKAYGSSYEEYGYSVQQTTDSGYIISGHTYEGGLDVRVYLIKTDVNGNLIWSRAFAIGNYVSGVCIKQTMDGGYVMSGIFRVGTFVNPYHVFLIRTDSNGNPLWANKYGGLENDLAYSVDQTIDGGFAIGGYTADSNLTNPKFYLIKTDSLGSSGCNQSNLPLVVDTPNTIVTNLTMQIINPVIYVTTPVFVVDSGGIATTLCTSVGINEITKDNSFLISPNPSTGNFIISFDQTIMKGTVEIVNMLGEDVYKAAIINETKKEINLNTAAGGIYFVKVFNGEKYYCRKVVVEQD